MRTDAVTFHDRPVFERVATGLTGIGAVFGVLSLALPRSWPLVPAAVAGFALLAAGTLRGKDDTVQLGSRLLACVAAIAIGVGVGSLTPAIWALGAGAGLVMAGTTARRQVAGAAVGALSTGWVLWLIPRLQAQLSMLPEAVREVGGGAACGLLFACGLGLLQLRLHASPLAARLQQLRGESGVRLQRVLERCHASLVAAPSRLRREAVQQVELNAGEAERLARSIASLDERLAVVDRVDAEGQLAALRTDIAAASDSTSRQRLSAAAASLSDSLEQLQSLDRKRERLEAELRLRLANLERAALGFEIAHGEPAEIQTAVLRLSAPVEA